MIFANTKIHIIIIIHFGEIFFVYYYSKNIFFNIVYVTNWIVIKLFNLLQKQFLFLVHQKLFYNFLIMKPTLNKSLTETQLTTFVLIIWWGKLLKNRNSFILIF